MGFGIRDSGIGSASSTQLRVDFRSARAALFPIPHSRFPIPGAETAP